MVIVIIVLLVIGLLYKKDDDSKTSETSQPETFQPESDLPAAVFSKDSWSKIASGAKKCINNPNSCPYKVGDEKEVDLGTYGKHMVRIANVSTPDECKQNNFSQSACGFVVEFTDVIALRDMNSTETNKGGWPESDMYKFLNDNNNTNSLINALPNELKNIIIDTRTVSGHGSNDANNFTSIDKLYLLSTAEVWENLSTDYNAPANLINYDTARDKTRQLDYYKKEGVNSNNYKKAIKKNGESASNWWLRSAGLSNNNKYCNTYMNGYWYSYTANSLLGVSPAFRIG